VYVFDTTTGDGPDWSAVFPETPGSDEWWSLVGWSPAGDLVLARECASSCSDGRRLATFSLAGAEQGLDVEIDSDAAALTMSRGGALAYLVSQLDELTVLYVQPDAGDPGPLATDVVGVTWLG
jgi:hypothetical protein